MSEYITEAIVLRSKALRDYDREVDLYTKDLGRVRARVSGGARPISKLSPHLDPLNLVVTRLVVKNQVTLTDVLIINHFLKLRALPLYKYVLDIIFLVRMLLPLHEPDPEFWNVLKEALQHCRFDFSRLLAIMGYNPNSASCHQCYKRSIAYFLFSDQIFLCNECARYFSETKLILVGKHSA